MTGIYEPYDEDQALAGPDVPPMKTIMDVIRYCITVHERFGNTCVEDVRLKWGGCALNARGDKDIEIERLTAEVTGLRRVHVAAKILLDHEGGAGIVHVSLIQELEKQVDSVVTT